MSMHIRRLNLKGLANTRDLGGMPTADGGTIVKNKLIRSGKLYKLSEETLNALRDYGVTTVVDLRIYTECDETPDTLWEGAEYYHLPVLCTATPGITREKSMRKTMVIESKRIKSEFGNADNYMIEMYRSIFFSEEPKRQLAEMLRLIVENEGCILWHCSAGKDRAGVVAMLIESLLGVDEKTIIQDYVATKQFLRGKFFWNKVALTVVPVPRRFRKILMAMMEAKPEYLPIREIDEKYGSVTEYCKKELGITDEDIAVLKEKYVKYN